MLHNNKKQIGKITGSTVFMRININKGKKSLENSSLLYQTYTPTAILKTKTWKWTIMQ